MQAIIDSEKCTGCGRCVNACPAGAIEVPDDTTLAVVDSGLCTGCGICIDECKKGAITLGELGNSLSGDEPAGVYDQRPIYGRGMGGGGRGRGRGRGAGGGGGYCVCPQCGAQVPHRPGSPCSGLRCARCGSYMVRNEAGSFI